MNSGLQKVIFFVILTFSINYLMFFIYQIKSNSLHPTSAYIVKAIHMLFPMIVAIFVQKFIYHQSLKSLGVSFNLNYWFLVAWLLPILIALLTLFISFLLPNVQYSPDFSGLLAMVKTLVKPEEITQIQQELSNLPVPIFIASSIVQALLAGVTINALFGFGEELGWRGLMQTELRYLGFWKSSMIIGLTWGLWHAPLILQGHNYPQHPKLGIVMMTIFTILLSPIFSYIRIQSNSVITVAILHGTLNAIANLPIALVKGGTDLTVGISGLAGFIALIIVIISLMIYDLLVTKQGIMIN